VARSNEKFGDPLSVQLITLFIARFVNKAHLMLLAHLVYALLRIHTGSNNSLLVFIYRNSDQTIMEVVTVSYHALCSKRLLDFCHFFAAVDF
jgi:hypothetical protein